MKLPQGVGVLLQARSGATRLPGKMTIPFYRGKGILEMVMLRSLAAFEPDCIVLATTTSPADDPLAVLADAHGIKVFRGSEHDVLQRFIDCAHREGFRHVLRICADNPFLKSEYLQALIVDYLKHPCDYVSYAFPDGTPIIRSHIGLFAEMVATEALERAAQLTNETFYHEHVTNFIYGNPEDFSIRLLPLPEELRARNDIRLTVDTPEDFQMASEIFAELEAKGNSLSDLIKLIDERPEMLQRMQQLISTYVK